MLVVVVGLDKLVKVELVVVVVVVLLEAVVGVTTTVA
jgi:hypothetical protein